MTTLFNVLLATARNLRGTRPGIATGGGATTLIDTNLSEPNDYFNGGTIFFLTGNNANKSAIITDWASATGIFTFATPGAACAAGDQYVATDGGYYTRQAMVDAINQALLALGPFDTTNTTLTTAANTTDYDLPAGVSGVKIVQFATALAAPYLWTAPYPYFREEAGVLILDDEYLPSAGYAIKLTYEANHARVQLDADVVTDDVNIERLSWEAAFYAAMNRSRYAESSEPNTKEFLGLANTMRAEMRKFPVKRYQPTRRRTAQPGD